MKPAPRFPSLRTPASLEDRELMEIFGRALQTARRAKGYRQRQMAFDLNLHPQQLSRIERGARATTVVEALKLCTYLGVTFETLWDGTYGG